MSRLTTKVAIVTGGASGFGKGIALKFVSEGCRVLITDLSEPAGLAVVEELNSLSSSPQLGGDKPAAPAAAASFFRADATSRADWEALLSHALATFGRVDVVVNNAGATYANKATEEVTDADFAMVMDVNVKSVFLSCSVLVPYFLGRSRAEGGDDGKQWGGGCFVQVASTAGVRPRPRLTWYNASKAAVINATKTMAVEYGPSKIRFNSVSPVVGSTGMTHLFIGKPDTAENRKAFESVIPLGRGSTPADVANACCYLASPEADFITGVNIEVDGGRCV